MMEVLRKTLSDIEAERPFTSAERRLLAENPTGEVVRISEGRPSEPTDDTEIRAELIKWMILGGEPSRRTHAQGVQVRGAVISGDLNLVGHKTSLNLDIVSSTFLGRVIIKDAELRQVFLDASHLKNGLQAHRCRIKHSLMLRTQALIEGTIDISSATIGGIFAVTGSRIYGDDLIAIDADKASIEKGAYIDGKTIEALDGQSHMLHFIAAGQLRFTGARIGGQFAVDDSVLGGQIDTDHLLKILDPAAPTPQQNRGTALDLEGAEIGRSLIATRTLSLAEIDLSFCRIGGNASFHETAFTGVLDMNSCTIDGTFFWRKVAQTPTALVLSNAYTGSLDDDMRSWDEISLLDLNGFRYGTLNKVHSVRARLRWLQKGFTAPLEPTAYGNGLIKKTVMEFDPKPYSYLAALLAADGSRRASNQVLEAREDRARQAEYDRAFARAEPTLALPWTLAKARLNRVWDLVFKALFGYGHQPSRALIWVLGICFFAAWLYGSAFAAGQMAPNSDVILTSQAWIDAVAASDACIAACPTPLEIWLKSPEAQDYETFNAALYAIDLFVPLDALGQESTWAPSKVRGDMGWWGYYMRMPVQMAGWIITAVGAAVVAGLIGQKD